MRRLFSLEWLRSIQIRSVPIDAVGNRIVSIPDRLPRQARRQVGFYDERPKRFARPFTALRDGAGISGSLRRSSQPLRAWYGQPLQPAWPAWALRGTSP